MLRKQLGKIGETIAVNYLRDQGHWIVERNFRTKTGEVDIICKKNKAYIFIEVKTRSSQLFGYPEEALTEEKLTRLEQLAQEYCRYIKFTGEWRIEAISIIINFKKKSLGIKHLTQI